MSQHDIEENGVEAVWTEPPTARWRGRRWRRAVGPLRSLPVGKKGSYVSATPRSSSKKWAGDKKAHQLWWIGDSGSRWRASPNLGKLKIGPARRLAEDLVWRGIFTEVARNRYGLWLKSGCSVAAVAMEFEVAAMVAGQSIHAEEKRGGKFGLVESCGRWGQAVGTSWCSCRGAWEETHPGMSGMQRYSAAGKQGSGARQRETKERLTGGLGCI
jgi:hypothetical protein